MLLAMLYIFFYNLGYGAMIWMTVVEILPQHVRSVAASLTGGFACLWYFLTTHTYRYEAIRTTSEDTAYVCHVGLKKLGIFNKLWSEP